MPRLLLPLLLAASAAASLIVGGANGASAAAAWAYSSPARSVPQPPRRHFSCSTGSFGRFSRRTISTDHRRSAAAGSSLARLLSSSSSSSTSDSPCVQERRVVVVPTFEGSSDSTSKSAAAAAKLQVLTQRPVATSTSSFFAGKKDSKANDKPILLFLHGSFHGAWCYEEHWFEHFLSLGYPVAALSWRGTGASPAVPPGTKKVKMSQHVQDLRHVLRELPDVVFGSNDDADAAAVQARRRGVVLVSHSFGGLAVMKLLEEHPDLLLASSRSQDNMPRIRGVVTMCSVPPSGNGPMTLRYLRHSLTQSWKITAGFALKRCCDNLDLCRDLFFSPDEGTEEEAAMVVSEADLKRYQSYFRRDSEATIDLVDLAQKLPSKLATKETGAAPYANSLPPCLVVGASRDYIVDRVGVIETAAYFGVPESEVVVVESPHDVMLGREWKNGADAVAAFLAQNRM